MSQKQSFPIVPIGIVAVLLLFTKLFVFDITKVYGHSMEPVISSGKTIVSCRISYGFLVPIANRYLVRWGEPRRGDIIVLENPEEKTTIVKRCIGIAGDLVDIQDGQLIIGEVKIWGNMRHYSWILLNEHIPEGHILVIGDNAENSIDSRSFGYVSIEKVYGKVVGFW